MLFAVKFVSSEMPTPTTTASLRPVAQKTSTWILQRANAFQESAMGEDNLCGQLGRRMPLCSVGVPPHPAAE